MKIFLICVTICFITLWLISIWGLRQFETTIADLEATIKEQRQVILNLRRAQDLVPLLEQLLPSISQDEMSLLGEKLKQAKREKGRL